MEPVSIGAHESRDHLRSTKGQNFGHDIIGTTDLQPLHDILRRTSIDHDTVGHFVLLFGGAAMFAKARWQSLLEGFAARRRIVILLFFKGSVATAVVLEE